MSAGTSERTSIQERRKSSYSCIYYGTKEVTVLLFQRCNGLVYLDAGLEGAESFILGSIYSNSFAFELRHYPNLLPILGVFAVLGIFLGYCGVACILFGLRIS
jgi:hypothetical protein